MAEFKFNCPLCKQRIACAPGYAGSQINCPACRQAIIVPPMPPAATGAGDRTLQIQIKVSTLRKTALTGLCLLLVAGVVTVVIYAMGYSTRTIWKEWSVLDGNHEQWSFAGGKIHGHSVSGQGILASKDEYGNVTFSATVSTTNREATLAIRLQDADNGYLILFAPAHTPCPWNQAGFIAIRKKVAGNETNLASNNGRNMSLIGQAAKIKVIARGPLIEVQVNGKRILRARDSTFAVGRIGLRMYGDPDYPCDATFSHVHFY